MRQRLSLTMRLTILFSLSSAVVLLGLGILIWLALDHHFANEDYVVLGDNIRLIQLMLLPSALRPMPDGKIAVTGMLFAADTDRHRTRVVLYVKTIERAYESR